MLGAHFLISVIFIIVRDNYHDVVRPLSIPVLLKLQMALDICCNLIVIKFNL